MLFRSEWWGLNDYAKGRAKQLAELGYVAFAADLYGDGKVIDIAHPEDAGKMAGTLRMNQKTWRGRAEAADGGVDLDHLTARFDGQTSVLNRSDLQHAGAGLEFFGGKRGQSGNSGKRKQKREPFHAAIIRRDIV